MTAKLKRINFKEQRTIYYISEENCQMSRCLKLYDMRNKKVLMFQKFLQAGPQLKELSITQVVPRSRCNSSILQPLQVQTEADERLDRVLQKLLQACHQGVSLKIEDVYGLK